LVELAAKHVHAVFLLHFVVDDGPESLGFHLSRHSAGQLHQVEADVVVLVE